MLQMHLKEIILNLTEFLSLVANNCGSLTLVGTKRCVILLPLVLQRFLLSSSLYVILV